jgi:hypothetical protein
MPQSFLLQCALCGHAWLPRVIGRDPLRCPKCSRWGWRAEPVTNETRAVIATRSDSMRVINN